MNRSLGNRPYAEKRQAYSEDSGYKAVREFAGTYESWTPSLLRARGDELARWAAMRWMH